MGLSDGGALSDIFGIVVELSDEEATAPNNQRFDRLVGWGYALEPKVSSRTAGPDSDEQFLQRQARPDEFFRKSVTGDLVVIDDDPVIRN